MPATDPPGPPLALTGAVRFERVSFAYPGRGEHSVRDLDLRIDAGESVGIVGRTGAGKSTLVNLLLGRPAPARCHRARALR